MLIFTKFRKISQILPEFCFFFAKFWPNFFGIFPKCSIFWKLVENGTVKFAISKKFASSQVQIWNLEVRSSSSLKSLFATQVSAQRTPARRRASVASRSGRKRRPLGGAARECFRWLRDMPWQRRRLHHQVQARSAYSFSGLGGFGNGLNKWSEIGQSNWIPLSALSKSMPATKYSFESAWQAQQKRH